MLEKFWHQRSRVKWATCGDQNSRFFHVSTVTRRRKNEINSLLMHNGEWETDLKCIKQAFIQHYKGIYNKQALLGISEVYPQRLLDQLPSIPSWSTALLEVQPTDKEIKKALMLLGPDKAPGPDGVNARLLQEQWEWFGPAILNEVKLFFETGRMPRDIARSNLILIPKSEKPKGVADYRPISVCNTIYKIISKLLAMRLQPIISHCIFKAQSAFIPGREIVENTILLREILHSFKSKNYKNPEFCLKVDLSKAFDRMDWVFLKYLLQLYGFPINFSNWVMACIESAEFSVVINGDGDGFFRPSSGLRQGCALSPYMFILGMDLLTRHLNFQLEEGELVGLRIARTASPLASCVYADDLLLFGAATAEEATRLQLSLKMFSQVSGQIIGPQKSSIWFSSITGPDRIREVSNILQV